MRGVCQVLIPSSLEEAFRFVADLMKALGVSLANPASGKITTWTDEGEQVEIASADLHGKVAVGEISNVQFWRSESEDIFVSWNPDDAAFAFSFYLDGVDDAISVSIASKLIEAVLVTYRRSYKGGDVFTVSFE
ncbi:hypothetical protein KNO81_39550 [Paraburkholderia sediminicola]|jgi:hypothetical protein|nr:hypothetical protein [Paraburkholderia sediminicola]